MELVMLNIDSNIDVAAGKIVVVHEDILMYTFLEKYMNSFDVSVPKNTPNKETFVELEC